MTPPAVQRPCGCTSCKRGRAVVMWQWGLLWRLRTCTRIQQLALMYPRNGLREHWLVGSA
jgi:hypothetical protein